MNRQIKTRKVNMRTEEQKLLLYVRKHHMAKHVVEIEISASEDIKRNVLATSDELRYIRNAVLGQLFKHYKQMYRTKAYKALLLQIKDVKNKLSNSLDEKTILELNSQLKSLYSSKDDLCKKHNVTFEYARNYGIYLRDNKFKKPDSTLTLSACEVAWKSIERIMFGDAETPSFHKKGIYEPLQGKQAERCIILKKDEKTDKLYLSYNKNRFDLIIKKNDRFIIETLQNIKYYLRNSDKVDKELLEKYNSNKQILSTYRICNNRIVIKEIRGKLRLFVQITLEGIPVCKKNKDGTLRHTLGIGRIGCDIGTQSIACVGKDFAILKNLAERSNVSTFRVEQKIVNLQRALDRSRRKCNPNNYNENGTIKKGVKLKWNKSNRYKCIEVKLKTLHKQAVVNRKYSINEDINKLRALGDVFIIEKMNFKRLQKKTKKVTKNKNGKFNKRKRFGKSILRRSPGYFISQAKYKFKITNGCVNEVNTITFKASQYDHEKDECIKKPLSKRYHKFENEVKVQRDLYSSFLLYCSNDTLDKPNKEMCDKLFNNFLANHNECIKYLKTNRIKVLNSGIKLSV